MCQSHLSQSIFEQSLKEKKFVEIWKEANLFLVHKKDDKSMVKTIPKLVSLQSLHKFMKELSIMLSSIISKNVLCFLNHIFCQATHV